ncbi:MAG: LysR family transcriptional regulator [Anaerolineae bacterium]
MELGHLTTFVAVAEERSISRAARRLFTTPSAVSMQVKALETELSVQLFVRTSRGVELTEIGRHLKAKAQQTLQSAQELADFAGETQRQVSGRAAVGLNATPAFLRVAALIGAVSAAYPAVELQFVSGNSSRVIEGLKSGKLDIGYIYGEIHDTTLEKHALVEAQLVVAAPRQWDKDVTGANWAELAQLPWIYADGYCPFQTLIDSQFEARGLSYNRLVLADEEHTKLELVAAGVGLTLMEESEARSLPDRVRVCDTPPLPCALSLAYLARRRHEPLIRALRQQMLALWHNK